MIEHKISIANNEILKEDALNWINSKNIIESALINDEIILENSDRLSKINTIWVKSNEHKENNIGLNYYGITIISNEEIENLKVLIAKIKQYYVSKRQNEKIENIEKLENLFKKIEKDNILIHFGV